MSRADPRIEALADDALLLRFGNAIDDAANARVHALAARLLARRPAWLLDVSPAYASLAVYFDASRFDDDPVDAISTQLCAMLADDAGDIRADGRHEAQQRIVEIPVAYGGDFGPDLESAAAELGLGADALARRHAEGDYRVAMIGFAPGFPYLSGLDPALALPRLPSPRTRVPAGSVAIGGEQTGVYPRDSPGGWRILGRTPLVLFDPLREPPSLLTPGDRVRFVAIEADTFATHAGDRA